MCHITHEECDAVIYTFYTGFVSVTIAAIVMLVVFGALLYNPAIKRFDADIKTGGGGGGAHESTRRQRMHGGAGVSRCRRSCALQACWHMTRCMPARRAAGEHVELHGK